MRKALHFVAHLIGCIYLTAWLLGSLGLVDFHVCLGKPGSCSETVKVLT